MIKPNISYPNISVWDDLIDDEFIFKKDKESNSYHWQYTNIANRNSYPNNEKGSQLFWSVNLFDGTKKLKSEYKNLLQFCNDNIIKQNFELVEVMINGQLIGQNGTCHIDKSNNKKEKTLMIFLNYKWEKEWGGQFQILENMSNDSKVVYEIDYKPGRIVLFDGDLPHRGLAPKVPNILRKSLIYRLEME